MKKTRKKIRVDPRCIKHVWDFHGLINQLSGLQQLCSLTINQVSESNNLICIGNFSMCIFQQFCCANF